MYKNNKNTNKTETRSKNKNIADKNRIEEKLIPCFPKNFMFQ